MATSDSCHGSTFEGSSLLPDSARIDELRDVLRSNAVPPKLSSFRRVADEAPLELARYDAEIERLKKLTAKLLSERATLACYSDGCRSVASPVRRLPTELLAKIFDLCAPAGREAIIQTDTMTPELERVAKNYLLQLAQVCSRWHSVAMGTPKLWSLIVFDTAVWTQHCCCSQTLLDLVTSSLRRGGECPLTLRIAVNHGDRGEAAVLQLLAEHSHRWKRVSLWINPPSLSHLLRAKGNLGRLRSLDLLNRDSASQSGSSNDIFELAPRLNVVRLINWRGPIPVLPWKQLRNAGLGAIGLGGILPLLSKRARIIIPPDLPLIVSQPVSSQITTLVLDLNGEHPETGGHFLQSLTLPRLKVFSVPRQASLPRWIHGPFLDFASRSSLHARLTRLALYVIIEDRELLECLAVLPLLKELYITDSDDDSHPALVTDNLLRSLMVRPDDTCLVPSLFRLQVTSRFTSHDDVVWDLITSRVNHQCLRDGFRLGAYWGGSQDHGFSPEFTARLKELEAADGGFHFTTGQDPSV